VSTRLAYSGLAHEVVDADTADAADLLERFASGPHSLVAPRDLARLHAPRPFTPERSATSDAFALVVGDSVDEILLAWARALMTGTAGARDTLWVSSAQARDDALMTRVGTYVSRLFGASHQYQ
jgi:hypothetical protein